jgi:hypothetical protein
VPANVGLINDVVAPVLHKYELAALDVNVATPPEHIIPSFAIPEASVSTIDALGEIFTTT